MSLLHHPALRRLALALGLLAGLLLVAVGPGAGADGDADAVGVANLTAALGDLAGDLKTYLEKDARVDDIAVGTFSGPPQLASSSGAAIKKLLTDELTERDIECTRKAKLSCEGRYSFEESDASVLLVATVFEGSARRKVFEKKVYDVEDITTLLGVTGQIAVDQPQRSEDLAASVQEPKVAIGDSSGGESIRISAAPDSPYAIEIYVKQGSDYIPRAAENDEGLAFVPLSLGDVYAIKIVNATPFAAAVTVTIDGLNMFEFSEIEAFRQLGKMVIPPSPDGFMLKGWHVSNRQSAEFQVAEFANGAVAQIKGQGVQLVKSDDDVGTITVSFAVAVPENEDFPSDEPRTQSLLSTRMGARIDQGFKGVPMKIGRLREAVSVRYSK
jgi:hypothetical protein